MAAYTSKIYIVQKYDRQGQPGEVIAVKLTFAAAHAIAKEFAPAMLDCKSHTQGDDRSPGALRELCLPAPG